MSETSTIARLANFEPQQTHSIAVTTSTGRVAMAGQGVDFLFKNAGTADCFVRVGSGTVTAAVTDFPILSGEAGAYKFSNDVANVIANTGTVNVAAITASGTTTLYISQGTGS